MRRRAVNRERGRSREALLALLAVVAVVAALAVILLRPGEDDGDAGKKKADGAKRASKPADVDLVITVRADGKILLDGRPIARPAGPDDLSGLMAALQERAAQKMTSRNPPVSGLRVRINAAAEGEYRAVQRVMVCCMRAYIWNIHFGDVPVPLPVDDHERGERAIFIDEVEVELPEIVEHPVFIHEEVVEVDLPELVEHPVFIHEAEASAAPPAATDAPVVSSTRSRPVLRRGGPPDEIRIKLWLSEPGRVVVSVDEQPCSDADELTGLLADFAARDPNMRVIIDSRQQVPFRRVLEAIESARRAGIRNILFRAPPVPAAAGSDWWYR